MKRSALQGAALVFVMLGGCGAEPAKPPAGSGSPVTTATPAPATSPQEFPAPPPTAGSQGSSAAPAPAAPDDAPGSCGSEICAADQFCEDLYKGHSLDARGRPIERKKCMPLPENCRAKPTCACVTKQVASTHCSDEGGHVYVNDYPARR